MADWPNPKIATRPEDSGKKLPSESGPHDFGAIRTRTEVSCDDLPIYDAGDHEKQIGTLSVAARVRAPLLFNPKDGSGADVSHEVFSETERQSLVFAEDPGALDAPPPTAPRSLGAVPASSPTEPAPPKPKRGGAAQAAARAKKPAPAPSGTASAGVGNSGLEAVAKQFKVPVQLLQHPDSVAAYSQSYEMVSQRMQLIGMEIQVCTAAPCATALIASCRRILWALSEFYRYVGAVQENMAAGLLPNGMPVKQLAPANTKTFSQCQKAQKKMEADMESGALTPESYAKTLVRVTCYQKHHALQAFIPSVHARNGCAFRRRLCPRRHLFSVIHD